MTQPARISPAPHAATDLVAHFQPIVCVRSGTAVGFEALARDEMGDATAAPVDLLASLDLDARFALFCRMLHQGMETCRGLEARLYLSINVDVSVAMREDFIDVVRFMLADADFAATRLSLEILEGEAVAETTRLAAAVKRLKRIGVSVALDDVGVAYASLSNVRDLPVDTLKLDQSFVRGLDARPLDLQFIWTMLTLARGLHMRLVVEGVETWDIYDALSILGVEYVQGYAAARPMEAAAVPGWLKQFKPPPHSRMPRSLLGAYASHLTVVETCQVLACQPLPMPGLEGWTDPHACAIGAFFDRAGLHETAFGQAHKRFHQIIANHAGAPEAWQAAAEEFRATLAIAIRQGRERR